MRKKIGVLFGTLIVVSICLFVVENGLLELRNNKKYADEKANICLDVEGYTETSASDDKSRILIISPLGRAGSSWIGEMLSEIDENTYYVFEPITGYWRNNIAKVTPAASLSVISDIFSCNFPEWMVRRTNKWPPSLMLFRKKCGIRCRTTNDFNDRCKSSSTFIIKDILTSLNTTRDILSMPSMKGLKVIYLVRDPRAQMFSRLKTFGPEHLVMNTTVDCNILNDGVSYFQELSKLFPGQLHFLRYEDICLNPSAETDKLWKFLKIGNRQSKTPSTILEYIKIHSQRTARDPYVLYRNSTKQWNSWRTKIPKENYDFLAIEKKCEKAMQYSGYIPLNEKKKIDNMEIETLGVHSLNNCE